MIKIAVLGLGRIGQRHLEKINENDEFELVGGFDIDPLVNRTMSENFSYFFTDSFEGLMDCKADVISICTPNGLHAKHAIACLERGFHVLVEKPMALSSRDCGAMIKSAENANKRIFVVKQNRFNPPVVAVKKLIDENKLGSITSFQLNCFWNRNEDYYKNNWKGTLNLDGGTLYTQFSHFIDLVYYLLGDVKSIEAKGRNMQHQGIIEFEDTGVVLLEMENGALGTINYNVNSYESNMEGSLTLFGTDGTVKIGGQYLNELEYQKIRGMDQIQISAGNKPNDYGSYKGSMSNHDLVYNNVADVLLRNGVISTNLFDGLKTVQIIERIYSKIHGGGR
jgi:predicted dehydrogenase